MFHLCNSGKYLMLDSGWKYLPSICMYTASLQAFLKSKCDWWVKVVIYRNCFSPYFYGTLILTRTQGTIFFTYFYYLYQNFKINFWESFEAYIFSERKFSEIHILFLRLKIMSSVLKMIHFHNETYRRKAFNKLYSLLPGLCEAQ